MPDRYARLSSGKVDEFLARKHGLAKAKEDGKKASRCPRCHEINSPKIRFCYKCGLPLDSKAAEEYERVRQELEKVLYMELKEKLKKELLAELKK